MAGSEDPLSGTNGIVPDKHDSDNEPPFEGFKHDEMRPAVLVLITLGILIHLTTVYPCFLSGIVATVIGAYAFCWFRLHGDRLTRHERPFFDEVSILNSMKGCEPGMIMFDEALTPYEGGKDVSAFPPPSRILDALFTDHHQMNMQKFYQEHYGGVWQKAERARKEMELMRSAK